MRETLLHALLIALGGALGALARWGAVVALRRAGDFPWGTLTVNVVGCLLAGLLVGAYGLDRERFSDQARLLVMVGFLGAFTTFSSFGTDTLFLLRRSPGTALLNVGLNLSLSLGATWLGATLGGLLAPDAK